MCGLKKSINLFCTPFLDTIKFVSMVMSLLCICKIIFPCMRLVHHNMLNKLFYIPMQINIEMILFSVVGMLLVFYTKLALFSLLYMCLGLVITFIEEILILAIYITYVLIKNIFQDLYKSEKKVSKLGLSSLFINFNVIRNFFYENNFFINFIFLIICTK